MLHGRVDQPKFIAIKLKHIGNNQHYTTWEMADILKIAKSIKSLMKMKNVSFILWKNYGLFGQPNNNSCNILRYIISRYCANDNDFIYVATFTVVLRYYDACLQTRQKGIRGVNIIMSLLSKPDLSLNPQFFCSLMHVWSLPIVQNPALIISSSVKALLVSSVRSYGGKFKQQGFCIILTALIYFVHGDLCKCFLFVCT